MLRTLLMALTVAMVVAAGALFARRVAAIVGVMRTARPTLRTDRVGERIQSVVEHVLLHRRMFRITLSGVLHYFIFSGFVVLLIDIVETVGEVFVPGFTVGRILAPLVDIWVILVAIGILLALYNRLIIRPARFQGSDEKDAFLILGLIGAIIVGIVIHDSFFPFVAREVLHVPDPVAHAHFLGWGLSRLWAGLDLGLRALAMPSDTCWTWAWSWPFWRTCHTPSTSTFSRPFRISSSATWGRKGRSWRSRLRSPWRFARFRT